MSKLNLVAMGQVGLTGWTRAAARPVARAVARRTGRPEAEILALIGAAFLAITLINFLREVDAVFAAGRTSQQPADDTHSRPDVHDRQRSSRPSRSVPGAGVS